MVLKNENYKRKSLTNDASNGIKSTLKILQTLEDEHIKYKVEKYKGEKTLLEKENDQLKRVIENYNDIEEGYIENVVNRAIKLHNFISEKFNKPIIEAISCTRKQQWQIIDDFTKQARMYIRTSEKGYYIVNKVMEEIGNYTEENIAEFTKKCNLMHEVKNNLKVLLKGIQIKDELHSDHKNRMSYINKKLLNENNDLGYSPIKIKKTLLSQNNYDNKRKSIGKETYIQNNEEIENNKFDYNLESIGSNY